MWVLETKTPLLCCRCHAPRPKARNATERQTEETVERPRKAHPCSFFRRRSGEKRCRSIPTMRPLFGDLGHPGRESDGPWAGKSHIRTDLTVDPTRQGPAKDDPEPSEPGCLSLQTCPPDGELLVDSTPPLGKPSFGWGLRSSEEVANHPTRRALFTEKEALPLRRESHFSARSPKGLRERTRR